MTYRASLRLSLLLVVISGLFYLFYFVPHHRAQQALAHFPGAASLHQSQLIRIFHQYVRRSAFGQLSAEQKNSFGKQSAVIGDRENVDCAGIQELRVADSSKLFLDRNAETLTGDSVFGIQLNSRRLQCEFDLFAAKRCIVLIPVPFDKRWRIVEDISPIPGLSVNEGELALVVEKGAHHIRLKYNEKSYFFFGLNFLLFCSLALGIIGYGTICLIRKSLENDSKSRYAPGTTLISLLIAKAPLLNHFASLVSVKTETSGTPEVAQAYRLNDKARKLCRLAFMIALPMFAFFYFLKWRTLIVYGDDLFVFRYADDLHHFTDVLQQMLESEKFRPVYELVVGVAMMILGKNIAAYFLVNVAFIAFNTYLFYRILALFLRSEVQSGLFCFLFLFSRFGICNITQLTWGGFLESLALMFFLFTFYHLSKVLTDQERESRSAQASILWSILFANLALCTHERYISVLPFILLIILFSGPQLHAKKSKLWLAIATVFSALLNICLKEWLGRPFLMGTGSTKITFSITPTLVHFSDALLSILYVNSGPDYLVGMNFLDLPLGYKLLILVLVSIVALSLLIYLFRVIQACIRFVFLKRRLLGSDKAVLKAQRNFSFLAVLLVLLFLPIIVTTRLEQRWLEAPFMVFYVMVAISMQLLPSRVRTVVFIAITAIAVAADSYYLEHGSQNLFFEKGQQAAARFKRACDLGVIRAGTEKIFIWEKKRDPNLENDLNWALSEGYFFKFYIGTSKELEFIDSVYKRSFVQDTEFQKINLKTDQILYLRDSIMDVTEDFKRDTLRTLEASGN